MMNKKRTEDEELLEQLAGEVVSVYVGAGMVSPRAYSYYRAHNPNIQGDERVVVTVRREKMAGRLHKDEADHNPT